MRTAWDVSVSVLPRLRVKRGNGSSAVYRLALFEVRDRDADGRPRLLEFCAEDDPHKLLPVGSETREFFTAFVPESEFP
ncbi:MAG: hypothetical protein PHU85_00215 [Phycisphaerae bacterium]|nr:hypothetical protein [Phycisphaerae bacterium]